MPLFKTNRDLDSSIIVVGVHLLMVAILALHVLGKLPEGSAMEANIMIVYAMIASYFFKSQKSGEQPPVNGEQK